MSTDKERRKTSSGHSSGLQSSSTFRENEKSLKSARDSVELSDPSLTGENADTVYRDRRGKKLDMLSEFMRQQASKEGKSYKLEQAQYSWGLGTVQKQQENIRAKELEEIALEPFARTADDPKLEALKKAEIRDGDPMAAYFQNKKPKLEKVSNSTAQNEDSSRNGASSGLKRKSSRKPLYKGPVPPPNRFKILPGYRWDGIDRGNQFEHKLLVKLSEKMSFREDEYKYLASDL